MMRCGGYPVLAVLSVLPFPVSAAGALPPAVAPLRIAVSLALVIALIGILALVIRRLPGLGMTRAGELRVLGTVAVGNRERVVLIEAGGSRMLLGVAPGRVQALHILPVEVDRSPDTLSSVDPTTPKFTATRSVP